MKPWDSRDRIDFLVLAPQGRLDGSTGLDRIDCLRTVTCEQPGRNLSVEGFSSDLRNTGILVDNLLGDCICMDFHEVVVVSVVLSTVLDYLSGCSISLDLGPAGGFFVFTIFTQPGNGVLGL